MVDVETIDNIHEVFARLLDLNGQMLDPMLEPNKFLPADPEREARPWLRDFAGLASKDRTCIAGNGRSQ